jgi:hypothetical protein
MVSSRSFGNDHLIDRLAAGIAGAAGRISTDSLRKSTGTLLSQYQSAACCSVLVDCMA